MQKKLDKFQDSKAQVVNKLAKEINTVFEESVDNWGNCKCDNEEDNCGRCRKKRTKYVVRECKNGGDCSCVEEREVRSCNKPCRKYKYMFTYLYIHKFRGIEVMIYKITPLYF